MIIIVRMEPFEICDYCGDANPKGERCECTPQEEDDFKDFNEACEEFFNEHAIN